MNERMLKKIIFPVFILLVVPLLVPGHEARGQKPEHPWGIALRGALVGNVYENTHSYITHGKIIDLLSGGFVVDGMYDFSSRFGLRLSGAMGKNAGACNSLQVDGGFYPYRFSSLNLFADAMVHFGKPEDAFSSRIYGGLGLSHTYDFVKAQEWSHDWDSVHGEIPMVGWPNSVFGFRMGYLGEWHISPEVGVLVDACSEFYTDRYNGLQPSRSDQGRFDGYGGFPFDLRFILSFGIAYHF